ncbi:unnamed protein product [Rhodiola kirilowii]
MEDSISTFCSTLASFCTHLQTNCDALTQSVQRRPIPLGSASSTFIRGLERRVTSANDDLNLLESMSFATVSFEELLGHCYEVFKSNQADISEIEDRLKDFGYCTDSGNENAEMTSLSTPSSMNPNHWWPDDRLDSLSSVHEPTLSTESTMKVVNEDPIESFSLKNLGLSDISIANLASEANFGVSDPVVSQPSNRISTDINSENGSAVVSENDVAVTIPKAMINVSKDDYENLPSYIRCLASWEDLLVAVEKLNKCINTKMNTLGTSFFRLDELEALGLGPKGRSYLLLLVRMNRLVVETIDGLISYRVV